MIYVKMVIIRCAHPYVIMLAWILLILLWCSAMVLKTATFKKGGAKICDDRPEQTVKKAVNEA